jgi:hypothetical protein
VQGEFRAGLFAILMLAASGAARAEAPDALVVATSDGEVLSLAPEELNGLAARPLASVKKTLDERFGADFLTLRTITLKAGTTLVGRTVTQKAPMRLTIYEISKRAGGERKLRVVSTWFRAKPGETNEFRTTVEDLEEQVFFVTAENVDRADRLNQHLSYLSTQEDTVTLQGYSTNWNLSALKLHLVGKTAGQQDESFTKDALWLVDQLISPEWVASLRVVIR